MVSADAPGGVVDALRSRAFSPSTKERAGYPLEDTGD